MLNLLFLNKIKDPIGFISLKKKKKRHAFPDQIETLSWFICAYLPVI